MMESSGLVVCLTCLRLRGRVNGEERRCSCQPTVERRRRGSPVTGLCSLCVRSTVISRGRWSWFGCGTCRRVNQTVGSVVGGHRCGVVPLGNHSLMNGVTIRGEGSDPEGGGTEALVELVGQWQRLSRWRQAEARRLVGSVAGILADRSEVPLDEWLTLFPASEGASVDALCRYVGASLPEHPKLRALEVAQLEFARDTRYDVAHDERLLNHYLAPEVEAVESFVDLEPDEQVRALKAIGQRIAAVLQAAGKPRCGTQSGT